MQVWAVGEYTSATYSADCSAENVGQMYEMLELLTYEVISVTGSTPASQAPYTIRLVSILMSAMAKVMAYYQCPGLLQEYDFEYLPYAIMNKLVYPLRFSVHFSFCIHF